jgi:hypothetical protein
VRRWTRRERKERRRERGRIKEMSSITGRRRRRGGSGLGLAKVGLEMVGSSEAAAG